MERARLFGLIAHDLRSPVAVISGYARMLSEGRIRAEEYMDAFLRIERAAARVATVSERCAELGRWMSPGAVTDLQPMAAETLVTRAVARVEARDRVTVDVPADVPRLAVGDRDGLVAILALVIEAVARDTAGPLAVRAGVAADGKGCDIVVGPSDAAADTSALSEADGTALAPAREFTQLAYYVAAAALEAHGGRAWLVSGRPERFGIRIPVTGL